MRRAGGSCREWLRRWSTTVAQVGTRGWLPAVRFGGLAAIGVAGGLAALVVAAPASRASSAATTTATTGTTVAYVYSASGGAGFHQANVHLAASPATDLTWHVEYGTTSSYGSTLGPQNSFGGAPGDFFFGGLQPGTVYHFQAFVTAPTAWSSGDLTFATLPTAPPVIDFYGSPYCSPNVPGLWTSCTIEASLNTKGLDTNWYASVATRSDFSDAVDGSPILFNAVDSDISVVGGGLSEGVNTRVPPSGVLYLQLHASNADGPSTSSVVTVSVLYGTPTTTTSTAVPPPITTPITPTTGSTKTIPTTTTAPATSPAATTTPTPLTAPGVGRTMLLGPRSKTRGCHLGAEPDRRCSPGAYYAGLTKRVICSPSFHPDTFGNVPESEKNAVEREYGLTARSYGSTLEIDHIVNGELGGSNDISNLFPERAVITGLAGYHVKDKLENRLHTMVCDGQISLNAARRQIASNWETLYQRVFGSPPLRGLTRQAKTNRQSY